MKIAEQMGLSSLVKRVGVGVTALVLAATFSMPTAAVAKEKKSAGKVTLSKKSSKKVSKKVDKKVSKSKILAKKLHTTKSKVVRKHRKQATELSSQFQWQPSQEPKQPYYVIPASVAGDVAIPQRQPDFLEPKALPTSRKAPVDGKVHQVGAASYYSDKFDGGRTASGERFDQDKLTCAHGSLPFGCKLRVTNLRNNKVVEVKVNDRGGFHKHGRVLDLSKAAAKEIGMLGTGTAKVKVEILQE